MDLKALLKLSCHCVNGGVVKCPGSVVSSAVGHGAASSDVELGTVRVEV